LTAGGDFTSAMFVSQNRDPQLIVDLISKETRAMKKTEQDSKPDGILLHLGALIGGLVMMVLGLGLSVTMVLLPVGLPLGLLGFGVFIWGLTPGWRR
jgi:hypothetical protein